MNDTAELATCISFALGLYTRVNAGPQQQTPLPQHAESNRAAWARCAGGLHIHHQGQVEALQAQEQAIEVSDKSDSAGGTEGEDKS